MPTLFPDAAATPRRLPAPRRPRPDPPRRLPPRPRALRAPLHAVWRPLHGERHLLEIATDPLVHRLERMAKSVRRDLHKMHAFVRFRRIEATATSASSPGSSPTTSSSTPPPASSSSASAPSLVDPHPHRSRPWDRKDPRFGPPARREDAPAADPFEAGWQGYYESTFNPARVNLAVTRGHMAKKYWKNLPETAAIPELVRTAPARVREMIEREAAMPAQRNPAKAVAAMCRPGPPHARRAQPPHRRRRADGRRRHPRRPRRRPGRRAIAFVGEQPGDQEDLQGRPFVGPAGQLLDRALAEAGIDRSEAYVTNAVKHFKFVQRGKRRLHQRPTAGEVTHYRWWLKNELDLVGPRLVVALGATAVLALAGKPLPITANRGETASTTASATSPCTRPTCSASPTRRTSRMPMRPFATTSPASARSPKPRDRGRRDGDEDLLRQLPLPRGRLRGRPRPRGRQPRLPYMVDVKSLSALALNCTLKASSADEPSSTDKLLSDLLAAMDLRRPGRDRDPGLPG